MNFDDEDEDVPRPRRRRKPKPRGMSTGGIVLLVTALGLAIAFVIGAGAWVAWRVGQVKRATEEELQAERDAEKLEAAAAFANPVPPTAAETAEFRRFFDSLGAILDRGDGNAANANFDIDRMADELARNGALDNIPIRDRGAFRRGMKQGAGAARSATRSSPTNSSDGTARTFAASAGRKIARRRS